MMELMDMCHLHN